MICLFTKILSFCFGKNYGSMKIPISSEKNSTYDTPVTFKNGLFACKGPFLTAKDF